MAGPLTRRLHITRRRIPLDRSDEYGAHWRAVRAAVTELGGRAWIFEAERTGDRFIEFIEWQAAANILEQPPLALALEELDTAFNAEDFETWVETMI